MYRKKPRKSPPRSLWAIPALVLDQLVTRHANRYRQSGRSLVMHGRVA